MRAADTIGPGGEAAAQSTSLSLVTPENSREFHQGLAVLRLPRQYPVEQLLQAIGRLRRAAPAFANSPLILAARSNARWSTNVRAAARRRPKGKNRGLPKPNDVIPQSGNRAAAKANSPSKPLFESLDDFLSCSTCFLRSSSFVLRCLIST